MKKLFLVFGSFIFASFTAININAQTDGTTASHNVGVSISEVALVDIESSATGGSVDITLDPNSPTEAGLGLDFSSATNSNLWLNYSSIVASGKKRTISATLSTDFPAGISLQVKAAAAVPSTGKGNLGQAALASATTLSSSSNVTVIDNIGSCYTGDGASAGSNLTYSVIVNDVDYASIVESDYSVTVTYTISDQN